MEVKKNRYNHHKDYTTRQKEGWDDERKTEAEIWIISSANKKDNIVCQQKIKKKKKNKEISLKKIS